MNNYNTRGRFYKSRKRNSNYILAKRGGIRLS